MGGKIHYGIHLCACWKEIIVSYQNDLSVAMYGMYVLICEHHVWSVIAALHLEIQ